MIATYPGKELTMRLDIRVFSAALLVLASSASAWADGTHAGGHYSFGEPGKEVEVTRTIEVSAEDNGKMAYKMDLASITQGETIKFVVTNRGAGHHEFSIGDTAAQRAHANLMKKNPHMKHENDPTAVSLEPGETKTLIWKFNKPIQGQIVLACQMPGHYDAGMLQKVNFIKPKKS